jgi:cbb3-type cytochrome oxidase maturation protein
VRKRSLPEYRRIETMEALYILIPLSVVIVFIALWAFFRMSDSGQFDDMVGPALRILQDDDRVDAAPQPATPKREGMPD